ncbi:MAG: hypothetical protein MR227_02930 [Firmicutes bacterium]|nr:hypothetical protein [Bacillota bacterium]
MKKMMVLLIAFLMFVGVKVEALEVNKITVEGKEIELKDNVYEYDVALDVIYSQVSIVVDEKDDVSYRIEGNENLTVGNNKVKIIFDDNTVYTLNILKKSSNVIELSNNNKLKNLSVSGYPLGFDTDKLEYNLTIGAEAKLRISYEAEDKEAQVYVEGNDNLVDKSVIRIKVVAQSGDVREYKINIKATAQREEIEVYKEEKYDKKLIGYALAVVAVSLFLIVINFGGKKENN